MSAITGRPTHEAASAIRIHTGRRAVYGVTPTQLVLGMELLQWDVGHHVRCDSHEPFPTSTMRDRLRGVRETRVPARLTLNQFMQHWTEGSWAVMTADHWIATSDGWVADSGAWFHRQPTRWDGVAKARAHVRCALRFHPRFT